MEIELKEITIEELISGYHDDGSGGVKGYDGKLDIRPPYQREFVYDDKDRVAVIDTVMKGFPLNVMYWSVRENGTYEVIDGQQRTISISQYATKVFSYNERYFQNLHTDERDRFLKYKLMIYLCTGEPSERLEWFKTINIAGKKLTDQELRNAVYAGSWVTDAKRYFSQPNAAAVGIGGDYMSGSAIRQEHLETAIRWISNDNIEDYMARNQNNENARELWFYFSDLIDWVDSTFVNKRPQLMRHVNWGFLYNTYKNAPIAKEPSIIETTIESLILDDDVTKKSGIYPFIFTREEKNLNIRAFSDSDKVTAYESQNGKCMSCNENFRYEEMEGDHITPWTEGGHTLFENLQMLCKTCNGSKSSK